ncbi:MAG: metallophosphoesterase [Gemmatimonadetes bacterium]|nr:metallophosphoesterase [Gemmatimonadota bacterium]
MKRRRFLALSAAAGAAAGLGVEGFAVETGDVQFTEHVVNGRRGADERRVTFAHVSDLHLRGIAGVHRRIAAEIAARRPAFVVLTGDSVEGPAGLPLLDAFLGLLDPAVRKYAVLGNWEHWGKVDVGALRAVYARHECRLLVNETVMHWHEGRGIAVTGLDDFVGKPDLTAALRGIAPAHGHLVLAHTPEQRDGLGVGAAPVNAFGVPVPVPADLAAYGVDAVLSGHTHGGQIALFGWAPVLPPGSGRYARGWFRDGALPPLFVSRGVGTTVMPVRLGSRPEVAFHAMWV